MRKKNVKDEKEKKTMGILLVIALIWTIAIGFVSFGDSIITFILIFPLLGVLFRKGVNLIWVSRLLLILTIFNAGRLTNHTYRSVTDDNYKNKDPFSLLITAGFIERIIDWVDITEEDERGLNEVVKRLKFYEDFEGDIYYETASKEWEADIKTDLNKLTIKERIGLIQDGYAFGGAMFGIVLVLAFFQLVGYEPNKRAINRVLWFYSIIVYGYTIYVLNPVLNFY